MNFSRARFSGMIVQVTTNQKKCDFTFSYRPAPRDQVHSLPQHQIFSHPHPAKVSSLITTFFAIEASQSRFSRNAHSNFAFHAANHQRWSQICWLIRFSNEIRDSLPNLIKFQDSIWSFFFESFSASSWHCWSRSNEPNRCVNYLRPS